MTLLAEAVLAGDMRALARAATLVENRDRGSDELLKTLFPHTGRAFIIGVTGSPGSGKSTLVAAMARALRAEARTVGIIAVDPTSPYSGGAILGDRVRMQGHHADPGVFIRSMATRGWMGGLARATTDMTLLLDAAGRDVILVETVGVGQDEVEIARLADATVVVLVPGMGDDVQAIKAGIMEIADVFAINKADQPSADKVEREVKSSLALAHRSDGWVPPVVRTVATDNQGVVAVLDAAHSFRETGSSSARAQAVWAFRLREMLRERVLERVPDTQFEQAAADVLAKRSDPYSIIQLWLDRLFQPVLPPHDS